MKKPGKEKGKDKWWQRAFWWKGAKEKYEKDGMGKVDEEDPEFAAQKIYDHWLKSFK